MNNTPDQILMLAPDESSKKSGKELANPSKWLTKGVNDFSLWGECQGSGSKPYQTVIDSVNLAFKCSCPSRKFPCKHGLGLALLYTRQPDVFPSAEAPPWAAEWISKRTQREEKKSEKKETVTDEAAQAKRQHHREQKVREGVNELHLWIKDIIRNGIMNMPEKGYHYWEGMAKRMIDAQAPGLAAWVKGLGQINFYEQGWQNGFIDQLATLYLLINAYRNKDNLSPVLVQDIQSWIGFTQSREELNDQKGIKDNWLVLGKQTEQQDHLIVERNWLYGLHTGQFGLLLQFSVKGQAGERITLTPGMYIEAELVYYPSISPLRVVIKNQVNTQGRAPEHLLKNWKEVAEIEVAIHAQLPFSINRPYVIERLTPVQHNRQWYLMDIHKNLVPVKTDYKNMWRLLAISGGEPLNMAVLGKELHFEPLGVWHQGIYKTV